MVDNKKQIVKLLKGMSEQQQLSLIDYAEYLLNKSKPETDLQLVEKHLPLDIPRPENEKVVAAIKRLRTNYFMLDTDDIFNEASSLMTQHILHGRDASDVIDEIEELFKNHYDKS